MPTRWWTWWQLQATFWIHRTHKSYLEKKTALESLYNSEHTFWKIRANNGMEPRDAVKTYFNFKD